MPAEKSKQNDFHALNTSIINLHLILSIAEDALNEFLSFRYRSFDALLGNNSCYLVSYIIFKNAQRLKNDSTFRPAIENTLSEIDEVKQKILSKTNHFQKRIESASFSEFIRENEIDLHLDSDTSYLTMAFTCTQAKFKNEWEYEETCYDKISDKYTEKLNVNIPKKSTKKLIKHWQKMLSYFNIKTLRSHVKREENNPWTQYLSDDSILEDQRGRLCSPSLYTSAFIFQSLSQIPGAKLGLQVNVIENPKKFISKFTIFFEVQDDMTLKVINESDCHPTDPIYMYTGCKYVPENSEVNIKEIIEEFQGKELKTIILAHEVTYHQYPKALKVENYFPNEGSLYNEIQKYQEMKGYSLDDPSTLCLTHIYVDDILSHSTNIQDPLFLPQIHN